MSNLRLLALLPLLFSLSITVSYATNTESIEHLNDLAKEFVQKNIALDMDETLEVKISNTNNQLNLAQCQQPIRVSLPAGTSSQQISTLEMTCAGDQAWHVYVPIDMKILTKVVIAKQTIPAKEIISEDMLDFAQYDKNSLFSGYYKQTKDLVGQTPSSTIVAGTVLNRKNVQPPILINRGQIVSIVSKRGTIMVKASGVAKSSGAFNDTIQVLNPSSKRLVEGVVVSSSTVEVRS